MSSFQDLPEHVFQMIETGIITQFATVSAKGVPIDTPTYYFPADDMTTIDVSTAMPNPAKAERARRNSKVGLLIEGRPEEPVVMIRAHAAVRDKDIQSNAIRYLAEIGYKDVSLGITWEEARLATTYWSRIIIENTPERIYWWDNHEALDRPPGVWYADANTIWPQSDPAPQGRLSPGNWPARPWRDVAVEALASGDGCHLSVLDGDGFPLPIRADSFQLVDEGFLLKMPDGLCWVLEGDASLTFVGFRTFIGTAEPAGEMVLFRAERALPQHPSTLDTAQVLQPSESILAKKHARLEIEMERRGQSLPTIPSEPPGRTRIAKLRMARIERDSPLEGLTSERGQRKT